MSPLSRRQVLAVGAGALASLAGCFGGPSRSLPESPSGEWRQRAHDARNTATGDVTVPPRGTPAWDSGEAHVAAPLVADGTVFSVSHEATALDARTGEYEWEADLPGKADYAPALLGDRLYVGAGDRFVALACEDGSEAWRRSLSELARAPVIGTESDPALVVVNVGNTGLLSFDPESGDRLWRDGTSTPRQPAIADDTVYVAGYRADGDSGVLRALDAADGSRRWEADLDHPDTAPIAVDDGLVVCDAGTVAVHDPVDGTRERELVEFGDRIEDPPAVADDTVYLPSRDGLAAVDLEDGALEWRTDVQVTADTGVTVGRDAVVAPITDLPGVAAFERSDGTRRWEYAIDGGFHAAASTPATLADGAVFITSNESTGVVALGDLPAAE